MTNRAFKMEYLTRIYDTYQKASKEQKRNILDEVCRTCRWHRKHAIRVLAGPPPDRRPISRRPTLTYSPQVAPLLARIWKASGFLCSQRLKPALPLWMPWAKQHLQIPPGLEQQLLAISPRQMDRRLAPYKHRLKRRIYVTTRPGSLLKRMIPVRTDFWDVHVPGFFEIDLVAHSGPAAFGDFIHTLDATDLHTTWSERQAVLGKSKQAVVDAMAFIENRLPFPLRGLDSDNGSEFINDHLYAFCRRRSGRKVQFTRSREYKKDDNAHIEQKNWTHVRKLIGWDRYDTKKALDAMNDLYARLRLFQNLFQPSMKLKRKVHRGSRLIRRYDTPATPLDRVLACPQRDQTKSQALLRLRLELDPFSLSQQIDQKLDALYPLASKTPHRVPPPGHTPGTEIWRRWKLSSRVSRRRVRTIHATNNWRLALNLTPRKEACSVTSSMAQRITPR